MSIPLVFEDRRDAGRKLAAALVRQFGGRDNVLVLGLPRGGVPVAFEVARALSAPLDVFVVRKLGVPSREELAMGAIGPGGVRVVNQDVIDYLGLTKAHLDVAEQRERVELERRERAYRGGRPPLDLTDKTVLLVDDGLATGATMRAAVRAARALGPAEIIVAAPTGSTEACQALEDDANTVICLDTPGSFGGVGAWYRDFRQTSDDEVRDLLDIS